MSKKKTGLSKDGRNFVVQGTVYPFDVLFSIDQTDGKLRKTLDKILPDGTNIEALMNLPDSCKGIAVRLSSGQYVVRLREKGVSTDVLAGNVAHEIFHVVTFLMDYVGVKFHLETSDEAYAYMIGYLTKEFYKKKSE